MNSNLLKRNEQDYTIKSPPNKWFMKKQLRFLLLIYFCFISLPCIYAQYKPLWEQKYGLEGDDEAYSLIETVDRGFVMTGLVVDRGKRFIWVLKLGAEGQPLWGKTLNRSNYDAANDIIETHDGGFAIAGYTWPDKYNTYFDFWIVRLDSIGDVLWDKTFGGKYDDVSVAIVETQDKQLAIAGYNESDVDYGADWWIMKLDENGNKLWDERFGGTKADRPTDLIETRDRGLVATGYTSSKGGGARALWVQKVNENGMWEWDETYRQSEWDVGASLTETYDNGIAVAGYYQAEGPVNYDVNIIKLDAYGNKLWNKTLEEGNWGQASSIIETYDKGLAVTGFIRNRVGDRSDFWVFKLDSAGNRVWDEIYVRRSLDYAHCIIETFDRGLAVGGSTYSVDAISSDFALLKFDNPLFPDDLQVNIINPSLYISTATQAEYTLQACIQTYYPVKNIQIYRNNKLLIDKALPTDSIKVSEDCYVPLEKTIELKPGENKLKVIATDVRSTVESDEHYIYYIPYLMIRW